MAYTLTTNKSWAETERELRIILGRWGAKEYTLTRGKQDATGSRSVKDHAPIMESPAQAMVALTVRWPDGREFYLEYNQQRRSVDNLRVLFNAIDAIRKNELRGIGGLARDIYLQLDAPKGARPKRSPYEVLDIKPSSPIEVAEASYRVLAKLRHPDAGGSQADMAELNDAIDQLRKGQTPL